MIKPTGGRGGSNDGGNGGNGGNGGGRKPPKEHQWTKGKSGNSKGRPRKRDADPIDGEVAEIILAEGFKPISVTEGGKPVSLPAVQAVFRSMLLSALRGNSHAGRSYVQHVAQAQAQKQKRKEEEITAAMALQMELERARIEFVARGRSEMEMALHPSDVEIDHGTGEVKNFLALTAEDRKARARCVDLRDYLLERIARSLAVAAEDGDDVLLQTSRELAHAAVVKINERLPPRFRRLPPTDKATIGPESTPEELWRAVLQPSIDFFTRRARENGGGAEDSDWPSSAPECGASGEQLSADTTERGDPSASAQDEEGEGSDPRGRLITASPGAQQA